MASHPCHVWFAGLEILVPKEKCSYQALHGSERTDAVGVLGEDWAKVFLIKGE